jgi:hypothetical protein
MLKKNRFWSNCAVLVIAAVMLISLMPASLFGETANFERIGNAEISSLTDFAGDAGAFTKKISPSLEALPFLAVIALTMNPQYAALDLSGQISMYMYAVPPQSQWCTVAGCGNADKIPREIKFLGEAAYIKKIDNRLLLSHSKTLLNQISKLPPPANDTGDNTISFNLKVARYIAMCQASYAEFRQKYIDSALLKSLQKKHGDDANQRMAAAVIELENIICQIQEISLCIYFKQDLLFLDFEIVPLTDSALAKFAAMQESVKQINLPPAVKDKDITLCAEIKTPDTLFYHLPGLFNELQNHAGTEQQFIETLVSAINGRLSYYTHVVNGSPVFFLKSYCQPEKRPALRKAFSAYGVKSFAADTYLIRISSNRDTALYCRILSDSIVIISGKINSAQALQLFNEAENPERLQQSAGNNPVEIVLRHQPNSPMSQINLNFKNNKIALSAQITPEFAGHFIPQSFNVNKLRKE